MTTEESQIGEEEKLQAPSFSVVYTCMRCGTPVTQSELSRLPEIKCICGFRVFAKLRPPVVKSLKAV
ncbi:MAG: RNA polymerase Rbp10 [Nitrosopumilaceae archaeon]